MTDFEALQVRYFLLCLLQRTPLWVFDDSLSL